MGLNIFCAAAVPLCLVAALFSPAPGVWVFLAVCAAVGWHGSWR